MRGALEPLDDFTTMIWPEEAEEFEKHTRGDFIGVGISIIKNRLDEIEVVTPLADTPAYRAGIQAGDIITKVDGVEIKDYSVNKVVHTITGPQDTAVTLTIRRDDKEIAFPLVRAKVKIQSVKGWQRDTDDDWSFWRDQENGIAYIRLDNFQRNTPDDLQDAMSELQADGVKGLILDLRWNPGGLLDSAWQISSLFLKRGDSVVSTKGRLRAEDQQLFAPGDGPYTDLPLVVLVDESSASASEIVSGAIRDNHRGVVMGARTFGKFSVQNLIPLGPSQAKLKITTAHYYLPSGVSLHREPTSTTWGVEPDIPLTLVQKERIKVRMMRRNADLLGPVKPKNADDDLADNTAVDKPADHPAAAEKKDETAAEGENVADGEQVADGEKKDELPPLEQPDENNRPDHDPQVDGALLLLRMKLLGTEHATLATAERNAPREHTVAQQSSAGVLRVKSRAKSPCRARFNNRKRLARPGSRTAAAAFHSQRRAAWRMHAAA
jgi:carboxyl-terminal processing protease